MIVNSTAEEIFDPSVKGAALKAAAAGNFDVLPMFDRAMETSSRERIRAIQLEKLIAQVAYTYENVAWYRDKMNEMGVTPEDIKTLEDIRKLPFTDKNALRETFPYGLFAQPRRVSRLSLATPSMTWPFGAIASRVLPAWRASSRAIACRWRSATACSPAVSASITAA